MSKVPRSRSRLTHKQWQRAETLGALVNGVFLVALCLSIFLDAIQRFIEPQEVSNPKLVLIVGCFGLLSNILGLLLFHEHGHSHGHGEEEHTDELGTAENGRAVTPTRGIDGHTKAISDESGNIADVLPQATVGGWPKSDTFDEAAREGTTGQARRKSLFTSSDEENTTMRSSHTGSTSPMSRRHSSVRHSRRSGSRSMFPSADEISVHPARFRKDFIASSRLDDIDSQHPSESGGEEDPQEATSETEDPHSPTESSPLLARSTKTKTSTQSQPPSKRPRAQTKTPPPLHKDHHHCKTKDQGSGGGHSHSDLNMKGVFLHVLGDALGNIGVISSALLIWLCTFPARFYFDPAISLVITIIILTSAIPLCKAASRILLQATPDHISIEDIQADICKLPGIVSCHHLHVWQLSNVKFVASLHIQIEFDFKGEGSKRYMQLAQDVKECLHEYGIHSSTIQPEFCLDEAHRHNTSATTTAVDSNGQAGKREGSNGSASNGFKSKSSSRVPSLRSEPDACLLNCGDACTEAKGCCPSTSTNLPENDHDR